MLETYSRIILIVCCSLSLSCILFYLLKVLREEFRRCRILTLCYQRPSSLLMRGITESGMIYVRYNIRFEEQIRYLLNHGYKTITIDDLFAYRQKQKKLPSKSLLIILDNAYLSNYLHIYPLIKKYDFSAIMFVTLDQNSQIFSQLKGIDLPLTSRQIYEMRQDNILIGSHGMSCRPFSKLSESELLWELQESKRLLEDITLTEVYCLAAPSNDFLDAKTQSLAQSAGYKVIFGNRIGTNTPYSDLLNLRKLVIKKDMDLHEFKKFISPTSIYQKRILDDLKTLPKRIKFYIKSVKRKDVISNNENRPSICDSDKPLI